MEATTGFRVYWGYISRHSEFPNDLPRTHMKLPGLFLQEPSCPKRLLWVLVLWRLPPSSKAVVPETSQSLAEQGASDACLGFTVS